MRLANAVECLFGTHAARHTLSSLTFGAARTLLEPTSDAIIACSVTHVNLYRTTGMHLAVWS